MELTRYDQAYDTSWRTDRTCATTRRRTGLNHLSQHLRHCLPARDNQASGPDSSPSFRSKVYATLVKTCARRNTVHLHPLCAQRTSLRASDSPDKVPADSSCEGRVSLHFTQSGLSIPTAAGVLVERGSEYILAHTGPRELDGHPLGGCGSGFGLVPGYTTLLVRVRANTQFGALNIKSVRTRTMCSSRNLENGVVNIDG